MKESKIVWNKYPEEKPKIDDEYIVSIHLCKHDFTASARWRNVKDRFEDVFDSNIIAWAEFPEPYKGDML